MSLSLDWICPLPWPSSKYCIRAWSFSELNQINSNKAKSQHIPQFSSLHKNQRKTQRLEIITSFLLLVCHLITLTSISHNSYVYIFGQRTRESEPKKMIGRKNITSMWNKEIADLKVHSST